MRHKLLIHRHRLLALLLGGALLVSCLPSAPLPPALRLPTPLTTPGPAIPFANPNLLGRQETHIRAIADTDALLRCLDEGQTVYGIALQNSNVRVAPQVNACRVGRIPRGNVVRVTGAIDLRTATRTANQVILPTPTPDATLIDIGFAEDIQPIFRRSCTACHSAVVKNVGLQVTAYRPLLAGGTRGVVVVPGDASASKLWQLVDAGKMPLTGALPVNERALIRDWINAGAPEKRSAPATPTPTPEPEERLWLEVNNADMNTVNSQCTTSVDEPATVVSSDLIFPLSCGVAPRPVEVQSALRKLAITPATAVAAAPLVSNPVGSGGSAPRLSTSPASGGGGIQAAALGLPPPSDEDGWLEAQGGFCLEQRLPENQRGITALAFAPDGRMFLGLDQNLTDEPDPLILYDAHHPSRAVAVYDGVNKGSFAEILTESSRIAGMTYSNGALYLNRAGEVGRIPDGGEYEPLAGGFAVNSQLFHANNGIAVVDGWLYVSAGGVIDGYSDGPIENIPEGAAQNVVSAGNGFAARLVRAPLDQLLGVRSITAFQTAARGLRNPYGLTADPSGRLWFTDNGATNVPENVSAGDEVNLFDPRNTPPGTGEEATPYYGFPLALTANPPDWYSKPVLALPNTSAPTGVTWAYGTIFFGQYGRDPGLYRLGRAADGQVVAERIMVVWPLLATATAPDGALWIGTGAGGLFRMTPGCG